MTNKDNVKPRSRIKSTTADGERRESGLPWGEKFKRDGMAWFLSLLETWSGPVGAGASGGIGVGRGVGGQLDESG